MNVYEGRGFSADGRVIPVQVSNNGVDDDPTQVGLLMRGEDRTGLAIAFFTPEEADDLGFALMTYARAAMMERK